MSADPIARLHAADPLAGELPGPLARMPVPERRQPAPARRSYRALTLANAALLATVLLHGVDHELIQGRGIGELSVEVILGGVAITAAAAISLAVAMRGQRRAPLVALIAGPWVAVAVVAGHFFPYWGEFSDPYQEAGVGTISYAVALAVVAAGLTLATVSVRTIGRYSSQA